MKLVRLFLVMLFCSQVSLVSAQEKTQAQLVDELLVKSGCQRQIEQIPDVIKASAQQRASQDQKTSAQEKASIMSAIEESFVSSEILKSVKNSITSGLSVEELKAILVWLNSPLGQKITDLEEKASSAAAYQDMQQFAQGLASNPPAPEKVALIERLDEAAQMTEFSVQLKIDIVVAMGEAMACAMGCSDSAKAQISQGIDSVRSKIEEGSKDEVLVNGLYTYQSLSDEELEQYISFYKTSAGQKYMNVIVGGLSVAIKDGSRKTGEKMGELLKQKKAIRAKNDFPI